MVNRELSQYKRLLQTIGASVDDLLANLDGEYPHPFDVESLWFAIRDNKIPKAWKAVSFPTARETLSDFLIELTRRLNYWKDFA